MAGGDGDYGWAVEGILMADKLQFIGLLGFLCKGGLGAKPPDPNTVAGSPEGGLERLGAHRKVQENLRVVMELVIFCNSFFDWKPSCATARVRALKAAPDTAGRRFGCRGSAPAPR